MRQIILILTLASMLLAPAGALAERRYVIRYGQTWDQALANGLGRAMDRGFALRQCYRQYREQIELLNRERIDQGQYPVPVKTFREWKRVN